MLHALGTNIGCIFLLKTAKQCLDFDNKNEDAQNVEKYFCYASQVFTD
jgi:hypothetical protein